jgi:autotransporter-associated beta strand protein
MKRLLVVPFIAGLLPAFFLSLSIQTGRADSATWKTNPVSGDWNHAANWTPPTIPNGPSDTATFGSSDVTDVFNSAGEQLTEVNGIVFDAGANAFTITASTFLYITGVGIGNNSGIPQNFVVPASFGISFRNGATAGSGTLFTINGSTAGVPYAGHIDFEHSSAGNGIFVIPYNADSGNNNNGGFILFLRGSTAGNGTFTINGGAVRGAMGGYIAFFAIGDIPTAANGIFTINGGAVRGAGGGSAIFEIFSDAGAATLTANGGLNGGEGGLIEFSDDSFGGSARVQVFGSGRLDISGHVAPGVTVGSIEGDGLVFLGARNLTVGSNHLSTNFSGLIQDGGLSGGTGGSLTKIGTGKLVLSDPNSYTGGTTVKRGRLIINNRHDSGTGSGPVEVNGGRFGGMGIVAGAVTVGSGVGREAVLSPGYHHSFNPGTLTIQSPLTFNSDGTYEIEVNSSTETVDKVVAFGVTINTGAQTLFADLGNGTFTVGNVFTVIDNTSATPIAGTFSDLPDGAVFTLNGNNFQASYTGGDGNDVTLTVVP